MPSPADYQEIEEPTLDQRRIEALWSLEASSSGAHLVLPDGRMDLVVACRLSPNGRVTGTELMIVGPSSRAVSVPVAPGQRFLGLRFKPGWGRVCLEIDAATMRDSTLSGAEADRALGFDAERLRSARSVSEIRAALVAAGRERAASARDGLGPAATAALDLLHGAGGRLSLPALAKATGSVDRTLRRQIAAAVGLPLKTLASVLRFQRTIRLLTGAGRPRMPLGEAAIEGGYSDQAHMTREFRKLGGFTPGRHPPVALGSRPIGGLAGSFKTAVRTTR
jgi:AraC-like DNA-binding protein